MEQTGYLISAVTIGGIILGAVVFRYLRLTEHKDPLLSTTLVLIGFILVSSPLWASIVVKGPQWEVSLLKKQSTKQAENYLALLEAYQKALPPIKAQEVSPDITQFRISIENLKKAQNKKEELKKLQEIAEQSAEIVTKILKLIA